MLAAENGAIPGGKVGGMGDVMRDVPRALAALGHELDVVTPGYQAFSTLPGARQVAAIQVPFAGRDERITVHRLDLEPGPESAPVRHWLLEHPAFAPVTPGKIYCDDPADRPFATDAHKFALFSRAALHLLLAGDLRPDVLHLHDWHTAFAAILLRYDPVYLALSRIPLVYTIHNLALQGVRPLYGDGSSLGHWFPGLKYSPVDICDPRYAGCVNPMRAAINLCDRIHAVSPTYAREIQKPADPDAGFSGGEGLDKDLQKAHREGRLHGILNGCAYDVARAEGNYADFMECAGDHLEQWLSQQPLLDSGHYLALRRLDAWRARDRARPDFLLTSVGRLTGQKVSLLRQPQKDGRSTLEHLLERLAAVNGQLIMLGSGDPAFEQFFTALAARHKHFLFLRGFSETLAHWLYSRGDLFLMPSSFEPCGISQMLAMRAGQPCLAHGTGGLVDTIDDDRNGFLFYGDTPFQQAENLLDRFDEVLAMRETRSAAWHKLCDGAAAARFRWEDVAKAYVAQLYGQEGSRTGDGK